MAQASLSRQGWDFEVERGPDWLFVRPRALGKNAVDAPAFAEQVWALLEQQFAHRLVLEMGEIDRLDSHLVGQLLCLYKRIGAHDGLMRVCGLSERNKDVLEACHLQSQFPQYLNREDAVMGNVCPRQPR